MRDSSAIPRPSRGRIVLAFAAIYLIWGSTYLAIRFAIETLPPFLMAGCRFFFAGVILYLWTRSRREEAPRKIHWKAAVLIGGLMLLGGNGGVTWAEQHVPSGLTALLIATVPLWIAVLDWIRPRGVRPTAPVLVGLLAGFGGVAVMVGPGQFAGAGRVDPIGAVVLILAALSWATGTLLAPRAKLPAAPLVAISMEMMAGGALLILAGLGSGELARLDLGAISMRSGLAFLYLLSFGSLLGFTAYVWLLGVTSAVKASTYAYVNPIVAVFLGWALAGEPLSLRTALAAAAILPAVAMITITRGRSAPRAHMSETGMTKGPQVASSDPRAPGGGSSTAS